MAIRHAWCAAAVAVAVAVVGLAGCGGGSKPAAKTVPTATAAVTTTAAPVTVKLSTIWGPKLEAMADGGATESCATPGSTACIKAITAAVDAYGSIARAIDAADAQGEYVKTVPALSKAIGSADSYSSSGCAGNSTTSGTCLSDALAVTAGLTIIDFAMKTDELGAG